MTVSPFAENYVYHSKLKLSKKEICTIFSKNSSSVTIEANKTTVDYLDNTLDLRDGSYRPYMKPNNNPLYGHRHSKHRHV